MSSTTAFFVSPSRRLSSIAAERGPKAAGRSRAEVVADQLLLFLRIPGLSYRTLPVPFKDGWETYTYGLEFEPRAGLPTWLRGPLVLRMYASEKGAPRARHEFAVQSFVHDQGFPTPRPILLVDDCEPFGGPFLLMERVPGRSLLATLRSQPWRVWDLPRRMAELQVRLHQLSPLGFPDAGEDFLDCSLAEIRARIVAYGLEGLWRGFDWLKTNRPDRSGSLRPLHLDWHPLNLIYSDDRLAALDWTEADVGDRHADVAMTLMMLLCHPVPTLPHWQRPFLPSWRAMVARRYLRAYQRRMALDPTRLQYHSARAALQRLAWYGRWLCAGASSTGSKPSALFHIGPDNCQALCRYFARHTGVEVKLEWDGW